jgi:hypothetical protein
MTKLEILKRVREILDNCCDEPAEQIIKEGEALVAIGKALKGLPIHDARAVIRSVAALEGLSV